MSRPVPTEWTPQVPEAPRQGWRPSLKTRMAIGVVCLITGALALSGWMYARHLTQAFTASVAAQQAVIAERLAAEVAGKLDAQRHQLEQFARSLSPDIVANQARLVERLKALGEFHPYLDDFWVASAEGRVVADFPPVAGRVGTDVSDREYFRRLRETGRFVVSEPTVGRFSGQGRVVLFAPIAGPRGEIIGAVGGVTRLQSPRLLGELTRQKVGESGYVGVTTAKGVVLAHPDSRRIMKTIAAGEIAAVDRMRSGFEGTFEARNHAGVRTVYTTRRIAGTDWFTYTAYPVAEAYGSMYRDLTRLAVFVALLAIAGGAAAWLLMSRLLAPLGVLDREMRRIASTPHAPQVIDATSNDEIGDLTHSFNRMLRAQVRAELERSTAYEQIHNTSRMFQALHDRAPLGMALLHSDGTFIRANPAFQKITGYTDDELSGMVESQLSAPEFAEADARARAALRESGSVAPYEKAYVSRNGLHVPVRASAVAVVDTGNSESVWWLVEDITARRQMMDALKASEAEARMLSAAASHTSNMVVIADPAGRVEWINAAFETTTGYSLAELKGRVVGHVLQGRDTDAATVEIMRTALAAREPFAVEVLNYSKHGRPYWVAVECSPVFDHMGCLERFVAVERDITEHRRLNTELRASEQRFRDLTDLSSDWFWETDAELRFQQVAAHQKPRVDAVDSTGRRPWEIIGVFAESEAWREHRRTLEARLPFRDYEFAQKVGDKLVWRRVSGQPMFDAEGTFIGYRGVGHDITESVLARQKLHDSEDRHRRIFESASDVIWELDNQGRVTMLNPVWERITGFSVAETLGRSFIDLLAEANRPAGRAALRALQDGSKEVFSDLSCFLTRDGEPRWFEIRARTYVRADGSRYCVGALHDVHDRRKAESSRRIAEEALRVSQERYARAVEGANDAIWERDLRTGKFYVSDRFSEMMRMEADTRPTTLEQVFNSVHPDDLEAHRRHIDVMLASGESQTWESRFRCADGSYRWLRIRGRTVRDAAGTPILTSGTASDIHDARVAIEELRAMQVRYQRAMDGSNDGVWERNLVTGEFYFSDRFDEVLGYPPGGLPRGRTGIVDLIHPEDLPRHTEAIARMTAIRDTVMWELRCRTAAGGYRWVRMRGIATRNAAGVPILTSGTASDIHAARLAEEELKRHRDNLAQLVEERTARLEAATHEAERQRGQAEAAREQAEEARRLAVEANFAKSEFLANMSHELRTPMHAIISFANFGVEKIERVDNAKLLHYFNNIRKSGARLLALLNDLLDLSKLEAGKMQMNLQPVDVVTLIGEALTEIEALARSRNIEVTQHLPRTAVACVDTMRMLQVLRNLLSNAIKFTPAGGFVQVQCAIDCESSGDGVAPHVEISVRDNGIGIPEAELESVFDKFVQSSKTKSGAGGTGLGLAICRELVAAHGGSINAFNNPAPAAGATFVVRIPLALQAATPAFDRATT